MIHGIPPVSTIRLRASLTAVHIVAAATLVRSVAYDRWVTVFAALALIVGAAAARRGRTWGIGAVLGAAAYFPVAWSIGIAPLWFCFVGLVGLLPFFAALGPLARFDKAATALGATLTMGFGAFTALAFRAIAPFLFVNFPLLRPNWSLDSGHAVTALLTILALRVGWNALEGPRVRSTAQSGVRVVTDLDTAATDEVLATEADLEAAQPRMHRRA